ncbi:MAG: hypothetical protein ACRYGO_03910 [Janthinobacterium lividum]
MKTILISLGVAFLAVAIVYISIFFLDPGMNVEKAFNIIFYAFFGSESPRLSWRPVSVSQAGTA